MLNCVKSGQIIIDKIGGPNRERHQSTDEILVADNGGPNRDMLQVMSIKTGGPNWERHPVTGEILITDSGGPNANLQKVGLLGKLCCAWSVIGQSQNSDQSGARLNRACCAWRNRACCAWHNGACCACPMGSQAQQSLLSLSNEEPDSTELVFGK